MINHLLIVCGLVFAFFIITFTIKILGKKPKKFYQDKWNDLDLRSITIEDIDKMLDGSEFESYLHKLLIELGYSDAYKTVGSRDFGADLVFTNESGTRSIIQAKRYSTDSSVGISAVQEVYTARNFYQAKKAIVISTTNYTDSCETLAGVNGVLLLDRSDLIDIITAYQLNDINKARNIIEREPRIIYEFWDNSNYTIEIKKEKRTNKM